MKENAEEENYSSSPSPAIIPQNSNSSFFTKKR
jgi:hypothetical protein